MFLFLKLKSSVIYRVQQVLVLFMVIPSVLLVKVI